MSRKMVPSKNWDDVPDMMSAQDYADVMGIHVVNARKKFKEPRFPKVIEGRVSKSELKRYLGINNESSEVYSILLKIKKEIAELKEYEERRIELIKSLFSLAGQIYTGTEHKEKI